MQLELTDGEMRTLLAALLIAIGGDTAILDDMESDSSWRIPLMGRRDRMSSLEKKIRDTYEFR